MRFLLLLQQITTDLVALNNENFIVLEVWRSGLEMGFPGPKSMCQQDHTSPEVVGESRWLASSSFGRLPAFLAPGFSLHLQCQQRSIFPPLPDSAPPLLSSHLLLWLTLLPPSAKDPGDDLGPLGSPELSPHLKIFHLSTLQSPFHHVKERVLDTKMWISFQRRFIIQPTTGINIVKVIRYYQFPLLCGWSNLNTALGTFMSSTPTIVSLFGSYKI